MAMMIGRTLWLLILWLTGTFASKSNSRPPFVSHVSKETLQEALAVAKQRHKYAAEQALQNYPVHTVNAFHPTWKVDSVHLKKHHVQGPILPDFANDLPSAVYVTDPPLFSKEECDSVIQSAETYFQETNSGAWPMQRSGQYQVAGFYIYQVPAVKEWFVKTVKQRLFAVLCKTFPDFVNDPDDLCVDNAYLFKYTPETGRRTDIHTDSGCLSFTIALNEKKEYQGGGTWFQGLQENNGIIEMDVGQVTFRAGGIKHCGHAVTAGTRYIIGGFCMHRKKVEPVRMLLAYHNADDTSSDKSLALLEAAVAMNPACDSCYNMLANHYENVVKDVAKAQQVMEYCLEHVNAESGDVAYSLGCIYLDQGLFVKARKCMETCLKMDHADVDARMGLSRVAAALGDKGLERDCYERVVSTPGAASNLVALAYGNLGVLAAEEQKGDEEIEYYLKSLKIQPHVFATRYSLGSAFASRKDWENAVAAFRQAVTHATMPEEETKSLQALYKSSAQLVMSQIQDPETARQEEMMNRLQEVMGADNYSKLSAMAARR